MKFENATLVPGSWDIPSGHVSMTLGTYNEMLNKIAKYEALIKIMFEEAAWIKDDDKLAFFVTLDRYVDWIKENFPKEYKSTYDIKKAERLKNDAYFEAREREKEKEKVENPF